MLPLAHLSCTPSVLQMKFGFSSGMQPPFTQTRPLPQELFGPHFVSQWPSMQMPPEPQLPPGVVHGLGFCVQTPFDVSHA